MSRVKITPVEGLEGVCVKSLSGSEFVRVFVLAKRVEKGDVDSGLLTDMDVMALIVHLTACDGDGALLTRDELEVMEWPIADLVAVKDAAVKLNKLDEGLPTRVGK